MISLATIQEKDLSLSDLKENFIEIYISELDKLNSIQIKEKANSWAIPKLSPK